MVYSVSFDFTQLRFCPRGLHTAREAVADARRSPKAAGSCAKWSGIAQARRRCGRFCGQHAQRCDVALLATAVSGVPIQPFSARVSCLTIGTTLLIHTNSSVLISVLRFLRANDFEKVGVERD